MPVNWPRMSCLTLDSMPVLEDSAPLKVQQERFVPMTHVPHRFVRISHDSDSCYKYKITIFCKKQINQENNN